MAIRYYDEALTAKLESWLKKPIQNNKLRILKPEETTRFFETQLDNIKDKPLALPLIAISRDKDIEILNTQKQSKTFSGFYVNPGSSSFHQINVIPIQIGYQIDIYTQRLAEADEYVRNFVFNLINYPQLEITLPYDKLNIRHVANIQLNSSISDNSDIKEHLFADQFVRFTLKIMLDDAYLFSLPEHSYAELELRDLAIRTPEKGDVIEPINEVEIED